MRFGSNRFRQPRPRLVAIDVAVAAAGDPPKLRRGIMDAMGKPLALDNIVKVTSTFTLVGDDGTTFTAKWEYQPTKPSRRATGISGWATIDGKPGQRLHICAAKPCTARYTEKEYYFWGVPSPKHGRIPEPAVAGPEPAVDGSVGLEVVVSGGVSGEAQGPRPCPRADAGGSAAVEDPPYLIWVPVPPKRASCSCRSPLGGRAPPWGVAWGVAGHGGLAGRWGQGAAPSMGALRGA